MELVAYPVNSSISSGLGLGCLSDNAREVYQECNMVCHQLERIDVKMFQLTSELLPSMLKELTLINGLIRNCHC